MERENSLSIVFIDYSRKRGTTEMKKEISTPLAPAAIGPYSQGIETDSMIFTSGQLPINMQTGELETDPKKATQASLNHIKSILKQAGYELEESEMKEIFDYKTLKRTKQQKNQLEFEDKKLSIAERQIKIEEYINKAAKRFAEEQGGNLKKH